MKPGDKNAYICRSCYGVLLTVDRDEGTTPMILACRATPCCAGQMFSQMYRLPPDLIAREPTHEWYKPTIKQARRKGEATLDHVRRGGLLLREISA